MRFIVMFSCLFSLLALGNLESRVIGGQEIKQTDRPEVVIVSINGAKCSGTIVGPQVVLTAAHCGDNADNAVVETVEGRFVGTFHRHPSYPHKDIDIAFIVLDEKLEFINPASLSSGSVSKGAKVKILGFGCFVSGGGGEVGRLAMGDAEITNFSGNDFVTTGAAVCFGDSGGPAYVEQPDGWVLAGTASKGNVKDVSYYLDLSQEEVLKFLKTANTEHGAQICGINLPCKPLSQMSLQETLSLKKNFKLNALAQNTIMHSPLREYIATGVVTDWFLGPNTPGWVRIDGIEDKATLIIDTNGVELGRHRFVLGAMNENEADAIVFNFKVIPTE